MNITTANPKHPRSPLLKIHLHAQVQNRLGPFLHALIRSFDQRYSSEMPYKKALGTATSVNKNSLVVEEAEIETAAKPAGQPHRADCSAARRTTSSRRNHLTARVTLRASMTVR
jgi:hypothetical protein